jgi:hypothetical protein
MIIRKNVTADWIIGSSFSRRVSLSELKMSSSPNDPSPALLDRIIPHVSWSATGSPASVQSRRIDCDVRRFPCHKWEFVTNTNLKNQRGSDCGPLSDDRDAVEWTVFPFHYLIVHCSSSPSQGFCVRLSLSSHHQHQYVPSATRTTPAARQCQFDAD